ncbi:MAG TPA: hypothetical protein VJ622_05915 [Acidimicrobiia bacterium]|nr:hypothetical protein [Acidimicrobiia bacterium]
MAVQVPVYGIPDHIENWATAIAAAGAAGSLAFCLRHSIRHRSPLALFLWIGGALTVLIEPFPDVLGRARFAQLHRIKWTGAFDSQIPAYIGFVYMFYLAPGYVLLLDAFRKGISRRTLGIVCAGLAGGAAVFEILPLHYDLWRYYGSQGLKVGKYPIWWGFVNAQGLIGTAVVLFLLLKILPRRSQFLIVPLMPPIFLGVHTAGSFFAYLTVGTTTNSTATFLGTLATDGLCCVFFWLYSLVVCGRPAPSEVAVDAGRGVEHHEAALGMVGVE